MPITPSFFIQQTMDHITTPGPMLARRPSAAKRIPTGKEAGAYLPWCVGPAKSKPVRFPTRLCTTWIGYRLLSQRLGMITSRKNSSRVIKPATKTFKVHLDGYNFLPHLTGKENGGPRKEIFYFTDDGDLSALRYEDWKLIFLEQRVEATLQAWAEPFVPLRIPLIFHLRRDPYERAQITSNTYYDWLIDRIFLLVPAQVYVGKFLATFKEFPPRQKAASFSLDQVMEKLLTAGGSK